MILTIDIGTSTFKAALFTVDGACTKFTALPLSIALSDGLRHEAESAQWLRVFEESLKRLGDLSAVEALVISGNGPSLVPVTGTPALNEQGSGEPQLVLPASAARLWLDRRAQEESAAVSAIMGAYVDPGFFLPKSLWIKNNDAALYEKTKYFLSCPEYLVYALTGEARTVFPSEGFDRWYWNDDVLAKAGLDRAKFPPFIAPGETIGTLLPVVARCFGFSAATASGAVPVIAGGPDFFAAILGVGAVHPGEACDRSGTSEGINVCTTERIMDARLMSYGHPVKPYWNLSGIISTTGKAIVWARELLGIDAEPFENFFKLADQAKSGVGVPVFLPYLAGERAPIWDPHARGVFLGLSLSSGRAELARSVAEGICFAIRDVITVMEECGAAVRELRVSGHPGESEFLNQLKADISGRDVLIPAVASAELMGLAALGAAALGNYTSAGEAAAAMVKIRRVYHGDEKKAARYERLFAEYRGAYQALKHLNHL
ncbi:xylulokinase [Spirochaetia bacterium]|nr:xylulokinase [Spirochaetia bacterium]